MTPLIDAYASYLQLSASPMTIDRRIRCLMQADFDLPHGLDEADTTELLWWLTRIRKWSQNTRCTYYRHLRGLYRFAVSGDDPWLYEDPTVGLPKPKQPASVPHPVDRDKIALALERSDDWWRLIIALGFYAGLRSSEILALRREDVTADMIRVRHGKGDKAASIPTHPIVWRLVQPRPAGLLVRDPHPGTSSALASKARRHFDRIGLPDVHIHPFRHSFCTFLLDGGVDIRTLQTLSRHSSLSTLAGYTQVADVRRRRAVLTLPQIGDAA